MKQKILSILLLSLFFIAIFYSIKNKLKNNISYAKTQTINPSVFVDAFIGEYRFTLYGYSSPNALVTLDGMGIYDQTYADKTGYFEFKNRFSPQAPREVCLIAQDQFGRTTAPNCIPPFPTQYDATIGPVIMPPTISLDAAHYYQGDEVKLSGQAVPNTNVNFSVFTDNNDFRRLITDSHGNKAKMSVSSQSPGSPFRVRRTRNTASSVSILREDVFGNLLVSFFGLAKPVEAFTFPQLSTQTDAKGNFSLSLPSSHPEFFRLFAQTLYQNENSPQSINLNLKILPFWMIIIQFLLLLWSIIASRLLEVLILGELIAITIFLIRRYTHPHVMARNRPIVLSKVEGLCPIVTEDLTIVPRKDSAIEKLTDFELTN